MKALVLLLLTLAGCAPRPIKVETVAPLAPSPVFDPPRERRVVTETSIEIYDTVTFVENTAEIATTSSRTLDAVADMLRGNPSIHLLQVRGHSDWEEPDRVKRAELGVARAENVVAALVARGVEPARLVSYGASDSELLSSTDPARNRRIELFILQRVSDD